MPLFCEKLKGPPPRAIWLPTENYYVYRGNPAEIILEMAGDSSLTVRQALQRLTTRFSKSRGIVFQLPWGESDNTLSDLFLLTLLELGISQAVPSA
jgi:hypothetical protein